MFTTSCEVTPVLSPFYRWENWSTERLSCLPKAVKLLNDQDRIQMQALWSPRPPTILPYCQSSPGCVGCRRERSTQAGETFPELTPRLLGSNDLTWLSWTHPGVFAYGCSVLCHVWFFVTWKTVAHQALLSLGFPRQEYWSGLPFPSPGTLSLKHPKYWL